MPLWFGIAAAVWGPVRGDHASTFIAFRFGWGIGNITPGWVARYKGVVVWWLVSAGIWPFVGSVGFLVNADVDSFELIVCVALPWFVGLVGAVWWWHSIALAVGYIIITTQGMVPVGFKGVLDDVVVSMVVKYGSSRQSWDFNIVADASQRSDIWGGGEYFGDAIFGRAVLHFAMPVIGIEGILHNLGFLRKVMAWESKSLPHVAFVGNGHFCPCDSH